MMFDQYVKLFHLDWIEPWMVEAVAVIGGAVVLMMVVCKVTDCMTGEK